MRLAGCFVLGTTGIVFWGTVSAQEFFGGRELHTCRDLRGFTFSPGCEPPAACLNQTAILELQTRKPKAALTDQHQDFQACLMTLRRDGATGL